MVKAESLKINIVSIKKTCEACPSQWEGWTDDGLFLYIRYRWGTLSVTFWEDSAMFTFPYPYVVLYEGCIGDSLDGFMDYEELKKYLKDVLVFPKKENNIMVKNK